jgi:hypothetical protein
LLTVGQTNRYIFTGKFPGIKLTEDEADALLNVLGDQPWWSSNAMDYPRLPTASRVVPIHSILFRIPLDIAWPGFQAWDRFLCVYTALAACVPFVNRSDSQAALEKGDYSQVQQKQLEKFLQVLENKLSAADNAIAAELNARVDNLRRVSSRLKSMS